MQVKEMRRLIADEGKALTDGKNITLVVDCFVDDVNKWSEIDEPGEDNNEVV